MSNLVDLTGLCYGELTVISKAPKESRFGHNTPWLCECSCGNRTIIAKSSLLRGKTTSCGCNVIKIGFLRRLDITNQSFGRLVAKNSLGRRKKHTYWECVCDCGKTVTVTLCNLQSGHTKSCGCLNNEIISARSIKNSRAYRQAKGRNPNIPLSELSQLLRISFYASPIRSYVFLRDLRSCVLCGNKKELQLHHIIPVSVDSSLLCEKTNLVTLCKTCHYTKAHENNWKSINPVYKETFISYVHSKEVINVQG